MGSQRERERWGRGKDRPKKDETEAPSRAFAGKKAKSVLKSYLRFYKDVMGGQVWDKRTKRTKADMLGKLHELVIDFMHFEELAPTGELEPASKLVDYLPPKDEEGDYCERWLHWKTLDGVPEIQDGPTGPLSKRFQEDWWQGVFIRIKGDANLKAIQMPRGHLKSELLTQKHSVWEIARDPSMRMLVRSLNGALAEDFINDAKRIIESDEKFRQLFQLGPPAKHGKDRAQWNSEGFQVLNDGKWMSSGKEPTMTAKGMESDLTGGHYTHMVFDDVVGEESSRTVGDRNKGKSRITNTFAVKDPGAKITDIGTVWEVDDAHSLFTDTKKSAIAKRGSSFFVATVLDGDESHPVGKLQGMDLSPLGYGKPIWPEKYRLRDVEDVRSALTDDRVYFGQYFNQIKGASLRVFRKEWIKTPYEGRPMDVARAHKLHIFMAVDPTQGKKDQAGRVDFTSAVVLGQTQDLRHVYLLDAFNQKLSADLVASAVIEMALHWRKIAQSYGSNFNISVEESGFTNYLHTALTLEQRLRGEESYFEATPFIAKGQSKYDFIRSMALPFSHGKILLPESLFTIPTVAKNDTARIEPYDCLAMFKDIYEQYPAVQHDDLIDAFAMAFSMTYKEDYVGREQDHPAHPWNQKGSYSRDRIVEEASQVAGYDDDAKFSGGGGEVW